MKVDVHVGYTFLVGPISSNQYGRLDVTYREIDTDLPLVEQLQAGRQVAATAFKAALGDLDTQVEVILDGKSSNKISRRSS